MNVPPSPAPAPTRATIQPVWTHTLSAKPRGLALARERGWLLAWDENNWLYLLNQAGQRQSQVRLATAVSAACCADDGSAVAAAGAAGEVWWMAPDLTLRWERTLACPTQAVAIDPFGQYLAVADARGGLTVFNRKGGTVMQVQSPRPFHFLAFVPAAPCLIASADYGLVACLDLSGKWLWRDGLVILAGALSVSGAGEVIVLACFTEGLQRYTLAGRNLGRLPVIEPCRLASVSFDGRLFLAAGLSNRLLLLNDRGELIAAHVLDQAPVALTLAALADRGNVALPDGRVLGFDLCIAGK
jgi:hypothetical protein